VVTALGVLATGCVGFGLLPALVLDRVVSPAATSLVNVQPYATAALHGGGYDAGAPVEVTCDYLSGSELATAVATVAAGLAPCPGGTSGGRNRS
jgi:hypothetical protein